MKVIGAIVLYVVSIFLSVVVANDIVSMSELLGHIFGRVFAMPILIMGIAALWRSNRNKEAMAKYFLWSAILVFVSLLPETGDVFSAGKEEYLSSQ